MLATVGVLVCAFLCMRLDGRQWRKIAACAVVIVLYVPLAPFVALDALARGLVLFNDRAESFFARWVEPGYTRITDRLKAWVWR